MLAWLVVVTSLSMAPAAAATLNFVLAASEPVTVTGTPRIAIDVGGVTRYASYAGGSGTASLTFSYAIQPGDFDANGITLASPLDLNGGSIEDTAGNPAAPLSFTLPDTTALKVQTYTAAFTTSPITNTNANAVSFAIAKAPTGASFSYTITSSGGAGSVSGSGTIGSGSHAVSGVDISALSTGTITLAVTISTTSGGTGAARTSTSTPTFTGVLDGLSATAAAYSVRRLRSAHTGNLIRVRRAADNAERDIAPTLAGDLDTTTLSAFCAATSCFVRTWYDQSGNGRDASQTDASLQPRIVDTGTLETDGGRASVYFSGTPGASLRSGSVQLNFSSSTIAAVCRNMGTTTNIGGIISTSNGGWGLFYDGATPGVMGYVIDGSGANQDTSANTVSSSSLVQLSAMYVSPSTFNASIYMNGILAETHTGAGRGVQNLPGAVEIGGRTAASLTARIFKGRISEAVLFAGALTNTSRQEMERNQGAYYGIAVP